MLAVRYNKEGQVARRDNESTVRPAMRTTQKGITVGQLRAALSDVPDDVEVVMSSDAEGNSHSPLADIAAALYVAESTWSGSTYITDSELDARIQCQEDGWSEEDRAPTDANFVIELVPSN